MAAVDELCATDPACLADGEVLKALYRQLARLEAVASEATARFDESDEWRGSGARTATGWLTAATGLDRPTVARRLRLGRRLDEMPVVAEAWRSGDIGPAHVRLLADGLNERTAAAFGRDEEMLVGRYLRNDAVAYEVSTLAEIDRLVARGD